MTSFLCRLRIFKNKSLSWHTGTDSVLEEKMKRKLSTSSGFYHYSDHNLLKDRL